MLWQQQWRIDLSLCSQDSFNQLLVHPHYKKIDFKGEVLTRFRDQGGIHYSGAQSRVEEARASSGRRDYQQTRLSSRPTLSRMRRDGTDYPPRFVPQQTAWIVERMGRFHRILDPGLAILVPIVDKIQYVKSLKEVAIEIPSQSAITADNVTLDLDASFSLSTLPIPHRPANPPSREFSTSEFSTPTKPPMVLKTPSTPFRSLPKPPCARKLVSSLLTRF